MDDPVHVPVAIAAAARHGKVPVNGKVELELSDSTSGRSLGLFYANIVGTVWIGRPLPVAGAALGGDRRPAGSAAPGTSDTSDASVEVEAPGRVEGTDPAAGESGEGSVSPNPNTESDPTAAAVPDVVDPMGEAPDSLLSWGFGAVICIALILVLLSRRR